jgi:hypothetical protein
MSASVAAGETAYEVRAFNTATASENKIHDDAVARRFCSMRWPASQRQSLARRSTVSLPLVCSFDKVPHRTRHICSSTHWYETRPMGRCCASRDVRSTLASPKPSKRLR